jgi:hypothetical protein
MDHGSNSSAEPSDRTQDISDRIVTLCLIVFAICIAIFVAWQVALYVPQRFERDYGEGFVWSEVEYFRAGRLYPPITDYPYTIMHYTPLYYAAVAALSSLGLDPLLAGRIVSLASGAALVWGCGLLAYGGMPANSPRRRKVVAGLAAAAIAAGMPELIDWSTLMRVDVLANCLGTMGLVALQRRRRGRIWYYVAGACYLLALMTKQNTVAPLIAGVAALAMVELATAIRFTGVVAAAGMAFVGVAEAATQGEFLRHILLYNVARFDWFALETWVLLAILSTTPLIVAFGFATWKLRQIWKSASWRDDPAAWTAVALSIYLAVGLVMSLGIAKIGAGPNYMLPLLVPAATLCGLALGEASRRWSPTLLCALALGVFWGLFICPFQSRTDLEKRDRAGTLLLSVIRSTPGPVFSEDMTLLMRAGRPVPWELGGFAELARLGIVDETPLVKRMQDGWFDVLIVYNWSPQFFTEAVKTAAQTRYQRVTKIDSFEVWERKPQ